MNIRGNGWQADCPQCVASKFTCDRHFAPKTYRGWDVGYELKPIPARDFDWTATSPDFDADCDQDGFFICSGQQVSAATFDALKVAIDEAIEEASA